MKLGFGVLNLMTADMFPLLSWIGANKPMLTTMVLWHLLTALLNAALRRRSAKEWENWALQRPLGAFVVELLRALGLDLPKAVVAFQRFLARRSGQVPGDALATNLTPPGIKELLQYNNPLLLDLLEKKAKELLAATQPPVPPPVGFESPPSDPV